MEAPPCASRHSTGACGRQPARPSFHILQIAVPCCAYVRILPQLVQGHVRLTFFAVPPQSSGPCSRRACAKHHMLIPAPSAHNQGRPFSAWAATHSSHTHNLSQTNIPVAKERSSGWRFWDSMRTREEDWLPQRITPPPWVGEDLRVPMPTDRTLKTIAGRDAHGGKPVARTTHARSCTPRDVVVCSA